MGQEHIDENKDGKKIRNMYSTKNVGNFPESLEIGGLKLQKQQDLRYGDNPHQNAALFTSGNDCPFCDIKELQTGKSGLSMTNLSDIHHAFNILKYLERPACAVMKHLNPCGVAISDNLNTAYINARDCDSRAAFGSVVAFNRKVDKDTAEKIMETFVECVTAPDFDMEALEIFKSSKNLRVIEFNGIERLPKYLGDDTGDAMELKRIGNGSYVMQTPFLSSLKDTTALIKATTTDKEGNKINIERIPSQNELDDMLLSWYVCIGVRSNAVVFVKDGKTIAIGTGEQERVGAVEQAIMKAETKHPGELTGSVVASDGFFPFRDSIDAMNEKGIKAIIQPGGSIKDVGIIKACNEHDITMVFTGERAFSHF